MLEWMSALVKPPKKIFIVQGEEEQQAGLEKSIIDNFNYTTYIPSLNEIIDLSENVVVGERHQELRGRVSENYFQQYRQIKQNLKELMKLRMNKNQIDELYDDYKTIEKVTRRYLVM